MHRRSLHGTRGGWHEGEWRVGAIVSAKEAALQLHRALWGREFGRGSDRHHALTIACYGRCTQAAQGRERSLHQLGAREVLVSESRLCPPLFTSTRHVTRERGLGGVAPKSGAPFCAARAGRAHAVALSFSSRLCSSSCQCSPCASACYSVRTFGDTWTTTFFAFEHDTRHGIHAPIDGLTPDPRP